TIDGITASGDNLSAQTNDGKVYRIKPRTNMDVNQWWTSDEIRYGWKFVHDDNRFRSPLKQATNNAGLEECDWNAAYAEITTNLKAAVEQHGDAALALMVSPMLPSEEAYLLGKLVTSIAPNATLAVGPIPTQGEDKTFPGGYTVYAEKCPNSRGVRRALEQISDNVLTYEDFLAASGVGTGSSNLQALVLTGNYPSDWTTPELLDATAGKYTVLIDTLPTALTDKADVLLPGATWLEKTGTFENAKNRIQSFDAAIPVIELAKAEADIALDLFKAFGLTPTRQLHDPAALRVEMGDAFATDVHHPTTSDAPVSDIEYVEL
ncbi:MAG: molybdopterin-dependent oxidoreductase, partial [Planctomycetota bacterium]